MKLNQTQWLAIEPILPAPKTTSKGGRPRIDNRQVLNGILYVLLNGCQWAELPPNLGAYVTCWRRYTEWSKDGTWEKIWLALFPLLEKKQILEWSMALWQGSFVPYKKT
jgi:transposase